MFQLRDYAQTLTVKTNRQSDICWLIALAASVIVSPAFAQLTRKVYRPYAIWDFSKEMSSVQPIRHVNLSLDKGSLRVTSVGNDPHFIGPAHAKQAGWNKATIRYRANQRLNIELD